MHKLLIGFIAVGTLFLLACSSESSVEETGSSSIIAGSDDEYELKQQIEPTIFVTTTAIRGSYGRFVKNHTCEGIDTSPPISWKGLPDGTKSLALIFEDPSSDELQGLGLWTHWVLYSIPSMVTELSSAQESVGALENGAKHGTNDYGIIGYTGPCPTPTLTYTADADGAKAGGNVGFTKPKVAAERLYYFRLYAVDQEINLEPGASRATMLREIDGHILGTGQAVVPYKSTKKITCRVVKDCLSKLQVGPFLKR